LTIIKKTGIKLQLREKIFFYTKLLFIAHC